MVKFTPQTANVFAIFVVHSSYYWALFMDIIDVQYNMCETPAVDLKLLLHLTEIIPYFCTRNNQAIASAINREFNEFAIAAAALAALTPFFI